MLVELTSRLGVDVQKHSDVVIADSELSQVASVSSHADHVVHMLDVRHAVPNAIAVRWNPRRSLCFRAGLITSWLTDLNVDQCPS